MTIRRYRTSDAGAVLKIFCETVQACCSQDYTKRQLDAWTDVDATEFCRRLETTQSYVAVSEDEVIGLGNIDATGALDCLYVRSDRQRRGVAGALCDEMERGYTEITVFASITAKPFFLSRGYAVVRENTAERKGERLKNFLMKKVVGSDET